MALVRGNRLENNQTDWATVPGGACSLMIFLTSAGNQIVDNDIIDTIGEGIIQEA